MKSKTRAPLVALTVLFVSIAVRVSSGRAQGVRLAPAPAGKIAPEVLAETSGGSATPVVVFLRDQADVSAAHGMKDSDARGWYVYSTLTGHAERTQAGLRAFLRAHGVSFQSFWAANMI